MKNFLKTLVNWLHIFSMILISILVLLVLFEKTYAEPLNILKIKKNMENNLVNKLASIDALMVAQTIGWTLEGLNDKEDISPVRFFSKSAIPKPSQIIKDDDFNLEQIIILRNTSLWENKNKRHIHALVVHKDSIGCCVTIALEASYIINEKGEIIIHTTNVQEVDAPLQPSVSLFFVPADKIDYTLLDKKEIKKLYAHVTKNGVALHNPKRINRSEKDYYVFAFFMDHLATDTRIDLAISTQPDGISGNTEKTVRFQENGWHVAYTPYRFAIDCRQEIFFKVLYGPGEDVLESRDKLIVTDMFTSKASGHSKFFIKQLQQALAESGYNPGAVDGLMGNKVRLAIKKFQKKNALRIDGKPSLALLNAINGSIPIDSSSREDTYVKAPFSKKRKTSVLKVSSLSPEQKRLRSSLKTKMWPNELKAP